MKRRTIWSLLTVACLTTVLLGACGNKATEKNGKASSGPEKLTIVQMPDENNPDAGAKHDGFRKALSEEIGIPVEEMEGADYAVGIEALKNKKLDILLVSPMSYYQAAEGAEIEPLVTTQAIDANPYKTVFITKKDNKDIDKLKDLKGKTFAFVDPASSSGYLFPKYELVEKLDLDPKRLEESDYFFKTVAYSGKHDSSVMGVKMGDYDAAAVAMQILSSMEEADLISKDDFKIIDETSEIPNACFIIRKDLPEDLKKKIKDFYLSYDDETYFETFYKDKNVRFKEAKASDYDEITEMIKVLGIEGEK